MWAASGGLAAHGLKERAVSVNDQQFVLGSGQRHALGGATAESYAGQVVNALCKLIVRQGSQSSWLVDVLTGREEHERARGLSSEIFEQREGIVSMNVSLFTDGLAHLLFRQRIVEIPLDGSLAAAVRVLEL
jgi:hypothetical protein